MSFEKYEVRRIFKECHQARRSVRLALLDVLADFVLNGSQPLKWEMIKKEWVMRFPDGLHKKEEAILDSSREKGKLSDKLKRVGALIRESNS